VTRIVLVDRGHDGRQRVLRLGGGSSLCVLGLCFGHDDREAFVHVAAALTSPDCFERTVGKEQQSHKQDKQHNKQHSHG